LVTFAFIRGQYKKPQAAVVRRSLAPSQLTVYNLQETHGWSLKRIHELYNNWDMLMVVLAEGLDMFRLEDTATGGNMNPSENFYFTKRSLTGLMSGS
jgi:hypothetical protein